MNLQQRPTRAGAIADNLARQIEAGLVPAGAKLPSIREYADANGCSKNTVISAFELLTAMGLVEPRRGSGFFVIHKRAWTAAPEEPTPLEHVMDTVWLMREQLQVKPGVLNLGEGFPPIEWLEETRLDQYHHRVARTSLASLFRYGSRFGFLPLRQLLQKKLADYEIEAPPSQIVLTHGANQAMDLVLRHLVKPGDTVLVDDPGYYPLFGKLKLSGANVAGIPRELDGPNIEKLEELISSARPRLFFTQSISHNPTGTDTSAAKAHRILQLADAHNLMIVEDDALADFRLRSLTRLSTLDQLRRTIYIGSFSKSVSASLRVGFIACNADLASDLADIKMLTHVSSSEYCERIVEAIVSDGHFLRHTIHLQDKLRVATERALDSLLRLGSTVYKESEQSLYLWAKIPGWGDSVELAKALLGHEVIIAPGSIFSPTPEISTPWCRFNVAYLSDRRFGEALCALG